MLVPEGKALVVAGVEIVSELVGDVVGELKDCVAVGERPVELEIVYALDADL